MIAEGSGSSRHPADLPKGYHVGPVGAKLASSARRFGGMLLPTGPT